MAFQLLVNLICKTQAGIVHREQEALYLQRGIEAALYNTYGIEQLTDAFKSEILGLYRDYNRVGGREGVHSNKAERRRAVNKYKVVFILYLGEQTLKHPFAVGLVDKLYLGTGKVNARTYKEETFHTCGNLRAVKRIGIHHTLVNRSGHGAGVYAIARSGIGLRVGVDNKDFFALGGKRRGQVYGRGGLADSAFLICYSYDFPIELLCVRDYWAK